MYKSYLQWCNQCDNERAEWAITWRESDYGYKIAEWAQSVCTECLDSKIARANRGDIWEMTTRSLYGNVTTKVGNQ